MSTDQSQHSAAEVEDAIQTSLHFLSNLNVSSRDAFFSTLCGRLVIRDEVMAFTNSSNLSKVPRCQACLNLYPTGQTPYPQMANLDKTPTADEVELSLAGVAFGEPR